MKGTKIMKKILSIISLVLVLVLATAAFTACGNTTSDDKATDSNTAANTADGDVAPKYTVLKMGTNATFPPYEYKEGEKIVGIDADIAKAIADELGAELEIVDMEFDSIITSVNQGEVDFGMAGMTITPGRKEEVDFTDGYATGIQAVIVPVDSDINEIEDLEGKKIGTQLGTTGAMYAADEFGEDNVITYSKGADAILALGGDVDAVIIDNEPAKSFVAKNEGLRILDAMFTVEDYAIAVKKGNTELVDDINAALAKLSADGTIDEIIGRYIKAE